MKRITLAAAILALAACGGEKAAPAPEAATPAPAVAAPMDSTMKMDSTAKAAAPAAGAKTDTKKP